MQGSPSCVNDHSGSSTQFLPFRSALRTGNISSAVADDQPFEKGWSENFYTKISPTVARQGSLFIRLFLQVLQLVRFRLFHRDAAVPQCLYLRFVEGGHGPLLGPVQMHL